jgi:hypothetical protein
MATPGSHTGWAPAVMNRPASFDAYWRGAAEIAVVVVVRRGGWLQGGRGSGEEGG